MQKYEGRIYYLQTSLREISDDVDTSARRKIEQNRKLIVKPIMQLTVKKDFFLFLKMKLELN